MKDIVDETILAFIIPVMSCLISGFVVDNVCKLINR